MQNDSTLFSYLNPPGRHQLHVQTIFKQGENGIHAIKKLQQDLWNNNPAWSNIIWKIDPLIDSAKNSLINKEYFKAEDYIKQAQELYPDQFFLDEYLRHIQFMTNEVFANERFKFDEVLGNYKPKGFEQAATREITFKNGSYYWGYGGIVQFSLFPTSASTFTQLDKEEYSSHKIIRKNGAVVGIEIRGLDSETMKIVRTIEFNKIDQPGL